MGCNCGKRKQALAYSVDLDNGEPVQTVNTLTDALAVIASASNKGPMAGYQPVSKR